MKRAPLLIAVLALVVSACSYDPDAGPATSTSAAPTTTSASTAAPVPSTRPPLSLPPNDGLARNQLGYVFPDARISTSQATLSPKRRPT